MKELLFTFNNDSEFYRSLEEVPQLIWQFNRFTDLNDEACQALGVKKPLDKNGDEYHIACIYECDWNDTYFLHCVACFATTMKEEEDQICQISKEEADILLALEKRERDKASLLAEHGLSPGDVLRARNKVLCEHGLDQETIEQKRKKLLLEHGYQV